MISHDRMEAENLYPQRLELRVHLRQGLDDGSNRPALHHFDNGEVLEAHGLRGFSNLPIFGFTTVPVHPFSFLRHRHFSFLLQLWQFRHFLQSFRVVTRLGHSGRTCPSHSPSLLRRGHKCQLTGRSEWMHLQLDGVERHTPSLQHKCGSPI